MSASCCVSGAGGEWSGRQTGKAPIMTDAELLTPRGVLVLQRRTLLDTLCAAAFAEERVVKPGRLSLLANVQTASAAIDSVLAELVTAEGVAL